MKQVKFIAELAYKHDWSPRLSLPALVNIQEEKLICVFETARPATSYWTDWGGYYDMPDTSQIVLFFDEFLTQAETEEEMRRVQKSYYINGTRVYIHLPYYPWTYPPEHVQTLITRGYASTPPDNTRPGDDTYLVNGVKVHYPVRLGQPSTKNELSDIMSGVNLQDEFILQLHNNDGKFDNTDETRLFNTPVRIRKTLTTSPTLADYKTIRYGYVQDIDINRMDMNIKAAEINKALNDQICRVFTIKEFPWIAANNNKLIGKPIPIAWGRIRGTKLFQIDERRYIPCDPDYITKIITVYDGDNTEISPSHYTVINGVIEINNKSADIKPKTCDFDGRENNKLGEIITSEIETKSRIPYTPSNWDTIETDRCIDTSPEVGILAKKGKVKELATACLKNDSAFLIIKNDGRLTLRSWDETYTTHTIPSWMLTQMPKKTHTKGDYFASSVAVHYLYNYDTKEYDGTYLLNADEEKIYSEYHIKRRREFETKLTAKPDAENLANIVLGRFRRRSEIVEVAVGYDTSDINPLDTVLLDMMFNERRFSPHTSWRVLEVDPAQDILKLEAIVNGG